MTVAMALAMVAMGAAATVPRSELQDCFDWNFAYGGDNILVSGKYNAKSEPEECQAACRAVTDCKYFSYYEESHWCELKFGGDNGIPIAGVISGPRDCRVV